MKKWLDNGKFKTASELALIFDKERYAEQPLIFSCGSGLTACINSLASELVVSNKKAVMMVLDGVDTESELIRGIKKSYPPIAFICKYFKIFFISLHTHPIFFVYECVHKICSDLVKKHTGFLIAWY